MYFSEYSNKKAKKRAYTQTCVLEFAVCVHTIRRQLSAAAYLVFDVGLTKRLNIIFAHSFVYPASFAARVNFLIMFTCKPKQMDFPFNSCVCALHILAQCFFSRLQNSLVYRSLNTHSIPCALITFYEKKKKRKKKKQNRLLLQIPKFVDFFCFFLTNQPASQLVSQRMNSCIPFFCFNNN